MCNLYSVYSHALLYGTFMHAPPPHPPHPILNHPVGTAGAEVKVPALENPVVSLYSLE